MARSQHEKLTDQHLRFCHEYVKDLNGAKAYLRAGYNCSYGVAAASACTLLKLPHIQAYLGEIAGLSEVAIVSEIAAIAMAQLTDVAEIKGGEVSILDSAQWNSKARAAVKTLTVTTTKTKGKTIVHTKVEMHDKLAALEKLAKKFKIYPKEIPLLDAAKILLEEGAATPQQAQIIREGIAELEAKLKSIPITTTDGTQSTQEEQ